jgi:glycerophosphoryl diester phosphodiesterase
MTLLQIIKKYEKLIPFAVSALEDDPAREKLTAERIAENGVNFAIRYILSLEDYRKIYRLKLKLPIEVEAAIGLAEGRAHAGFLSSTRFNKAVLALRRCKAEEYRDLALRAALRAAQEWAGQASFASSERPPDIFDLDWL